MQLHALENTRLIGCSQAKKGIDYTCPECFSIVRLKMGKQRHPHFFHLKPDKTCHLAQKSASHLHLQQFLKEILVEENPKMEKSFPSIRRIADLACTKTKKIFEIQCSPISLEEAQTRCQDYQSLGYQVVWILHDKRYNKRKVSLAEQYLRASTTTYFFDITKEGKGRIYDQLEHIANHRRQKKSIPLFVNLQKSLSIDGQRWSLFHEGDSIDADIKGLIPKLNQEKKYQPFQLFRIIKNFYLIWFHRFLEKASK